MQTKSIIQIGAWLVLAATSIGLGFFAKSQQRTISLLREQDRVQQERLKDADRQRAASVEVQQSQNQEAELQQLRDNTRELMRLRNEARQLKEQVQELETLRAANAQLLQAVHGTPRLSSNQSAIVSATRRRGAILGVNIAPVNDPRAGAEDANQPPGALVVGMEANSAVAQSGLEVGDVIIQIDGRRVETPGQLQAEMLTRKPGQMVVLDVLRGGQPLRFNVTAREWPP